MNVEQEKAALMAADAEWSKTHDQDIEKFSVVLHARRHAVAGRGARDEGAAGDQGRPASPMMKAPGFNLTWQATRAEVSASGDLGYTAGHYTLKTNTPSGMPVTEKGKFQTTWKKIDGAWKVIEDTATSDGPPATRLEARRRARLGREVDGCAAEPAAGREDRGDLRRSEQAGAVHDPAAVARTATRSRRTRIPTDEHVTVLSGTFAAAMGENLRREGARRSRRRQLRGHGGDDAALWDGEEA